MNKKGMTLLELMVYIALAALLLAPVIMLMHNSSLNMARDAKALDLRVSGRDVLNIMYSDIINTGFKIKNFSTLSTDTLAVYRNTSSSAPALYDSSSFKFTSGDAYDNLEFVKGILDEASGVWEHVEKIQYYTDQSTLIREVISKNLTFAGEKKILAYDVEALKFEFSEDMETWLSNEVTGDDADTFARKAKIKYIRVTIALRDNKQIASFVNSTPDVIAGHTLAPSGANMREIHSIVIPVPNNGLYPIL